MHTMSVVNPVHFFKSTSPQQLLERYDTIVVGAGMAGLTAAALLSKQGKSVLVLERNYLPGGCSSSYFRSGAIFDSGATTLVGLSDGMPLRKAIDELNIQIDAKHLEIPMQVHLDSGICITRYQDREEWIAEAERVFGIIGQRKFWQRCFEISDFVWEASMRFRFFPPSNFRDLIHLAQKAKPGDFLFARFAFQSMEQWMKECRLDGKADFVRFVDQQLMITAQNTAADVNLLFGATALCYTNYPNYSLPGGMVTLVRAFTDSIASNGGHLLYRCSVQKIKKENHATWLIEHESGSFRCNNLVSAIPVQNFNDLISPESKLDIGAHGQLNSALQFNAIIQNWGGNNALHHQVHLPGTAGSVFFSVSDRGDLSRSAANSRVLSATTHSKLSNETRPNKEDWAQLVMALAEAKNLFKREDVLTYHVSDAANWEKWTGRYRGFVGGIPQFMRIKPWMMNKQQKGNNLFFCGDSVYPGQGIPGVVLSGWQVAGRMLRK